MKEPKWTIAFLTIWSVAFLIFWFTWEMSGREFRLWATASYAVVGAVAGFFSIMISPSIKKGGGAGHPNSDFQDEN
jgi:hypothetical protein